MEKFAFYLGLAILIALSMVFLGRKTRAILCLSLAVISGGVFIYFGFFNITGTVSRGSVYTGIFIITVGLLFYFKHRRSFDFLDVMGLTPGQTLKKLDLKTFNAVISVLEPFLQYHQIPYTVVDSAYLKIDSDGRAGIEIVFGIAHENTLVMLNGYTFFFNHYEEGQFSAISKALFAVQACLCESTTLRKFQKADRVVLQIWSHLDGESIELSGLTAESSMVWVSDSQNCYISEFHPKNFLSETSFAN